MATDRDTYIHRRGVTPETASIISSKNKIYAIPADVAGAGKFQQIGVLASFDPSETRSVEAVRGIGYGDHIAELVPGNTEPMTFSVNRTAQYLSMIFQVFGYKGGVDGIVRSLRHHKWPFDIHQEVVISKLPVIGRGDSGPGDSLSGEDCIITVFEGCWISDWGVSYAADQALVQENVTINVTDIIAGIGAEYVDSSPELFNSDARSRIVNPSYNQ